MPNVLKLIFGGLLLMMGAGVLAQDDAPDYLRNPVLPPFTLMKADSTKFTQADIPKGKKTIIVVFSPDCGHCRNLTEGIIQNIEKLQDIVIVMTSFDPLPALAAFNAEYSMHKYSNILVGRDFRYFFTPFYAATGVPFLALYNEAGRLLTTFDNKVSAEALINAYKAGVR
jgi:cytochrome oxidase Cu insertion factor (SCO1/SenC/PrrC family)